ncbi:MULTISPECIES: thioredoxin family protein [Neobacillus]|uniref:Thioredoxin family protein n=1 Tax=Neobacillus citreus TaxID=2833578 RepID=A0A942T5P0_9BACI|nr:thioredoxin family protein [Neobacillus citreus]MCH6264312.1 thioredoxin family protein [Neobacillus citreus]
MENIKNLEQYEELKNGEKAAVMLFSADWCPDCRFIDTFIDEIIENNREEFDFYKIDSDARKDICAEAGVMGIPSLVAYKSGRTLAEFIGNDSKTKEQIEEFLEGAKAKL